jgi:aryl-alcohol dehydrogenase-like predicted oxidoreductase
MKYRTLGKSGIRVSEIGVGGHQETVHLEDSPGHAGLWSSNFDGLVPLMPHDDRAKVIGRALDLGVNYFDTSLDTETESLGLSLRILGRRDEAVVTLVTGVMQYMIPATRHYWAKKAVAQDINCGLRLFGYDHFDVCIVCMCNMWYGDGMIEGAMEALIEAKQAGKVRAIGFSDHQDGNFSAYMLRTHGEQLDMMMYPLSWDRREAEKEILPLCSQHNVGYVAMKALSRGDLLHNEEFAAYAESIGNTPAVAALQWVLDHPEVSLALNAVNALREIEENAGASE